MTTSYKRLNQYGMKFQSTKTTAKTAKEVIDKELRIWALNSSNVFVQSTYDKLVKEMKQNVTETDKIKKSYVTVGLKKEKKYITLWKQQNRLQIEDNTTVKTYWLK